MASKYADIEIEVNSPVPEGECTSSFFVEYKLSGDPSYSLLNGVGYTNDNPIRIQPLNPDTTYDYRITRNCCNGQDAVLTGSFTTPS